MAKITDKDRIDFIERMLDKNGPGEGCGVNIGENTLLQSQPGMEDRPVQIFSVMTQHLYGKTARELIDTAIEIEKGVKRDQAH